MSTDALSDVLSAVRLSGSVFFDVTAKSPWVAEAPPGAQIADDVAADFRRAAELEPGAHPAVALVQRAKARERLELRRLPLHIPLARVTACAADDGRGRRKRWLNGCRRTSSPAAPPA